MLVSEYHKPYEVRVDMKRSKLAWHVWLLLAATSLTSAATDSAPELSISRLDVQNGMIGFRWERGEGLYQLEAATTPDGPFQPVTPARATNAFLIQADPARPFYRLHWYPGSQSVEGEHVSRELFYAHAREIADLNMLPLAHLRELVVPNNGITSVESLRGLTGLRKLWLFGNPIRDLSPLSTLTQLEDLNVSDITITNADFLVGLTHLRELWMSRCGLSDVRFASSLTKLTFLSLSGNQIADLSPLQPLIHLKELRLDFNPLSSVKPLGRMKVLESLQLAGTSASSLEGLQTCASLKALWCPTNIATLEPLRRNTALEYLYFPGCGVTNLAPIAGLTRMREIIMHDNHVSDLSPLSGMTNLRTLYACSCGIRDISPLRRYRALQHLDLCDNPVRDIRPLLDIARNGGLTNGAGVRFDAVDNVSMKSVVPRLKERGVKFCSWTEIP